MQNINRITYYYNNVIATFSQLKIMGRRRMAFFEDCLATTLTTQPPRHDLTFNFLTTVRTGLDNILVWESYAWDSNVWLVLENTLLSDEMFFRLFLLLVIVAKA